MVVYNNILQIDEFKTYLANRESIEKNNINFESNELCSKLKISILMDFILDYINSFIKFNKDFYLSFSNEYCSNKKNYNKPVLDNNKNIYSKIDVYNNSNIISGLENILIRHNKKGKDIFNAYYDKSNLDLIFRDIDNSKNKLIAIYRTIKTFTDNNNANSKSNIKCDINNNNNQSALIKNNKSNLFLKSTSSKDKILNNNNYAKNNKNNNTLFKDIKYKLKIKSNKQNNLLPLNIKLNRKLNIQKENKLKNDTYITSQNSNNKYRTLNTFKLSLSFDFNSNNQLTNVKSSEDFDNYNINNNAAMKNLLTFKNAKYAILNSEIYYDPFNNNNIILSINKNNIITDTYFKDKYFNKKPFCIKNKKIKESISQSYNNLNCYLNKTKSLNVEINNNSCSRNRYSNIKNNSFKSDKTNVLNKKILFMKNNNNNNKIYKFKNKIKFNNTFNNKINKEIIIYDNSISNDNVTNKIRFNNNFKSIFGLKHNESIIFNSEDAKVLGSILIDITSLRNNIIELNNEIEYKNYKLEKCTNYVLYIRNLLSFENNNKFSLNSKYPKYLSTNIQNKNNKNFIGE